MHEGDFIPAEPIFLERIAVPERVAAPLVPMAVGPNTQAQGGVGDDVEGGRATLPLPGFVGRGHRGGEAHRCWPQPKFPLVVSPKAWATRFGRGRCLRDRLT